MWWDSVPHVDMLERRQLTFAPLPLPQAFLRGAGDLLK